jgi:hypothetical protein
MRWAHLGAGGFVSCIVLSISMSPTAANGEEFDLFDRFAVYGAASTSGLDTRIRLDTPFGDGTELDFEDDLDLDEDKTGFSLRLDWQLGRRHRLSASWIDLDRDGTRTTRREIEFGDIVIPVNASLHTDFGFTDYRLGYTYFLMIKDRSAFGLEVGARIIDFEAQLGVTIGPLAGETETADVLGPFPFIGAEFRYGLTRRLRLVTDAGWLELEIGDFDGGQALINVRVEHLVASHFLWGVAAGYDYIDVDVDKNDFFGSFEADVGTLALFAAARW